ALIMNKKQKRIGWSRGFLASVWFLSLAFLALQLYFGDPVAASAGITFLAVGAVKISDRFASQCSVVFNNNYDTHGTITRSSIEYLNPTQLESLFAPGGLFADMDAWFKTSFEMKACGTRTFGLYDWIMSGADREKGKAALNVQRSMGMNPGVLFP